MKSGQRGAVYALGNFDGVHRGHRHLLAEAARWAAGLGVPLTALTFEPHSRRFFAPDLPPFRLTLPEQKRRYLIEAGCAEVEILRFDATLAAMGAEDFVRQVLVQDLGALGVAAGADFRFGQDRVGDMAQLAAWLEGSGAGVLAVGEVRDPQGQRYAASTVRTLLSQGQVQTAAAILGRPYTMMGTVAHGDRRGRELGFPTANIDLGDYQRPAYGVYAVRARPAGGAAWFGGVANIGRRPTVDGVREWLELHIFDFAQEIYGEVWEVALMAFVRPETRFADLKALRVAIGHDAVRARELIEKQTNELHNGISSCVERD